jgi:nicotinamidase-related amidase
VARLSNYSDHLRRVKKPDQVIFLARQISLHQLEDQSLNLHSNTTALILVDLQKGVVPTAKAPRSGSEVVRTAKGLASRFREANAPVFLVHVSFEPGNTPSQNVDEPRVPPGGTPPEFSHLVPGLSETSDIVILKHHWGAFIGTDLDLLLRRRGCRTVVIGGITTNMGVESTARSAWELTYDVVIIEDATASSSEDMHAFAIHQILPQIARVVAAKDLVITKNS